jgi:hypothetical protein
MTGKAKERNKGISFFLSSFQQVNFRMFRPVRLLLSTRLLVASFSRPRERREKKLQQWHLMQNDSYLTMLKMGEKPIKNILRRQAMTSSGIIVQMNLRRCCSITTWRADGQTKLCAGQGG